MHKRYAIAAILAASVSGSITADTALAIGVAASTVQPTNWYRADAINGLNPDGTPKAQPAPNAYLQTWLDSSGNNNEANQGPGTNRRPTFRTSGAGADGSLPVVRFNLNSDVPAADGSAYTPDEFMNILPGPVANTADSKLTVFIVSKDSGTRTSASSRRGTVLNTRTNGNVSNGLVVSYGQTNGVVDYAHIGHNFPTGETTTSTVQEQALEDTDFSLIAVSRNALTSTLTHYTDGGTGTSTVTWGGTDLGGFTGFTPSTLTRTQLGTEGGGNYFFGDIAEIVIFNETLLGTRDTKIVTNYLGEKYGITSADLADLPGDTNTDYKVDFSDLVTLAQHYNQSSGQTRKTGDFNGDGAVNFADLVALAQNYNVGAGTLTMPAGASAEFKADFALAQAFVPEPTTLGVVGLATLCIGRRRR